MTESPIGCRSRTSFGERVAVAGRFEKVMSLERRLLQKSIEKLTAQHEELQATTPFSSLNKSIGNPS